MVDLHRRTKIITFAADCRCAIQDHLLLNNIINGNKNQTATSWS